MTNNIYQGDPKLILSASGVNIPFTGGQPEMDQGLENLVSISLFTAPGFWGNDLMNTEDQKIGSDYEETANNSITLQLLRDIEQAAERALKNPIFGELTSEALNPQSNRLEVKNLIKSPGNDIEELIVIRNGQNWINQALEN